MNALYTIELLESTSTHVKSKISIDKDSAVFDGHFPTMPVMPGVCMIQMLTDTLSTQLNRNLHMSKASQIKFINMWLPQECSSAIFEIDYVEEDNDVLIKKCSLVGGDATFFKCKARLSEAS